MGVAIGRIENNATRAPIGENQHWINGLVGLHVGRSRSRVGDGGGGDDRISKGEVAIAVRIVTPEL